MTDHPDCPQCGAPRDPTKRPPWHHARFPDEPAPEGHVHNRSVRVKHLVCMNGHDYPGRRELLRPCPVEGCAWPAE